MAKKVNLAKEAEVTSNEEPEQLITEELLLDLCPKDLAPLFKKHKTAGSRADFYYIVDKGVAKMLRDKHKEMDGFLTKLEQWFVQELDTDDTSGISGKQARVEIKRKEIATVEDWTKFYGNIKKKGEFELLNKAINQKAVKERWEAGKEVPGVTKFVKKVVSLTAVKGNK